MQERQELNLQPPVLETGALPIELLSYLNGGNDSLADSLLPPMPLGSPSIKPPPEADPPLAEDGSPLSPLLSFLVLHVLSAVWTIFFEHQFVRRPCLILCCRIIAIFTPAAR